jgi:ComF family protein
MRPLLHLLKYEGMRPIAERMGLAIARELAGHPELPRQPLVVPVPLFAARQKQRGFNQAELLAEATVRALRKLRPEWEGELAVKLLVRRRASQSQTGLSLSERRRNLRGAFFVSYPDTLQGRDVILIDDIYTTGATTRACSRVLKRAGAATIWVATAARAQRHDALQRIQFQQEAPAPPSDQDMRNDVAIWGSTLQ